MIDKKTAEKFVSLGTHKQLAEHLYVLEHVTSSRDIAKQKENLREDVGKLFTYKEIFELHDDHILELAETIEGLYPERDDLEGYLFHIFNYLDKRISKYEKKRMEYINALKAKEEDIDPDGYLDLKYKTWTYTKGYFHQQAHMYRLLKDHLKDVLYYAEKGLICKRKKIT